MTVDPVAALVVGAIIAAVPTVIAFLMKRSIDALDKTIDGLARKVETLSSLHVEFARLEVRVQHLEDGRKQP